MVRTEKWRLAPPESQRASIARTVTLYRLYVRDLSGIVFVHWPVIANAEDPVKAVEALMHPTRHRPQVRYQAFATRWHKFPSYYRRGAIMDAVGAVSSFITRYSQWQSGRRTGRTASPPRFNRTASIYPSLYRGQCIKYQDDLRSVEIKVHDGNDWVWIEVPIAQVPRNGRHLLEDARKKCPQLVIKRGRVSLHVPYERRVPQPRRDNVARVVGVDMGLNTAAVASVVDSSGTVTRREFYSHAVDMDSRDRRLAQIRKKARLTMGGGGKLSRGFCKGLYRKAANINENIAQQVSRSLVNLALDCDAQVIVFERLKGWRPRGGRRRSALRQRFHGWMHRRIVALTEQKAEEAGLAVRFVLARGTSSNAFDGSGPVSRDKANYSLATFKTGKRYNADLSASYNIAARYWARSPGRKRPGTPSGKSSGGVPRMPVTLSTLWKRGVAEGETPTTAAKAA